MNRNPGFASAEDIAADPAGAAQGLIHLAERFRAAGKLHQPRFGEISTILEETARDIYGKAHSLQRMVERVKSPIPKTAGDFQLYSNMKGVARAAQAMHNQMKKDVEKINTRITGRESDSQMSKKLRTIAKAGIKKLMDKYRDFGARDTEPENVVGQVYADVAKKAYGLSLRDYKPEWVEDLFW